MHAIKCMQPVSQSVGQPVDQAKQKPGQVDFGRLLTVGSAATMSNLFGQTDDCHCHLTTIPLSDAGHDPRPTTHDPGHRA